MNKKIALLLSVILLLSSLCACSGSAVSKSATVEGSIFGGKTDDRIRTDVRFDTKWLTKQDNTVYQPELSQFCALLSADSYFREKDYAKQRQNRVLFDDFPESDYDFTSFLSSVGFTEVEHYESYLTQETPTDSNDSVTLTIGHQTVGGKYDVYAVVVRGCFSMQEWCSIFDPGCAGKEYSALTGEHPEWTETAHFKGMDVAANRASAFILDFMEKTGDKSLPDRILLTGHSRGGGIANLLGAAFEKNENVTSYTYTFNAPGVTTSHDTDSYYTIFNVFDSGDFFSDPLPFAEDPFVRYGSDVSVSVSESPQILEAIAKLKGRSDYSCVPAEAAAEYKSLFAQRFPNRGMLYDMVVITRSYATREDAEAGREECLAIAGSEAGLGLGNLYQVGEIKEEPDGSFSVSLEYCGAALLRTCAMILAYGESAYDGAVSLFAEDESACQIASILCENAAGINGGHLLANSYVVAGLSEINR